MNRKNLILSTVVSVIFYSLYSCSSKETKNNASVNPIVTRDSLIKQGGYLVSLIGCAQCHSPKIMTAQGPEIDPARIFSGYDSREPIVIPDLKALPDGDITESDLSPAFYGPWGISFASNLTSDDTGIGNWSEAEFKKALVHNKFMGIDEERNILPPMRKFSDLSDGDVKAIFTYLKTTRPVHNVVPAYIPPRKKQ